MTKPTPRPYQTEGTEFLRDRTHAYLADEMGLGKTMQLVRAAQGDTLVIAPATIIASGSWADEAETWADDPGRFHFAPYSSLTEREKTGKGGTRPTKRILSELDRHWDTLILDEAHYVKNARAARTDAVRKIARRADRVYLASGTPVPNWPHELFVPLQLLRPEAAKAGGDLGSYWRWIERWFKTVPNQYAASPWAVDILGLKDCRPGCGGDPLRPCEHYREFTAENFQGAFLQRLRDDVLQDLPPLQVQEVRVPFTPRQGREYRRMKREYIATVADSEIVAWSSAARNTMLDRITTSLGLVADGDRLADSGKLTQLREDLEGRSRPTLVMAHYRDSVEACARVARDLGLAVGVIHGGTPPEERGRIVQRFRSGLLDVLAGSLETVAEGLNLTAADMVILVETSYKPSRNQQAIRRIHRIGQTRPCTVRDYIATTERGGDTLDGRKRELLARKTDTQTRTMTAAMFKELL